MEEKTIKSLNKKWYYRFVKVVYIIFFVFLLIIGNYIIFTEYFPSLDLSKTQIICNLKNRKILNAQDINLSLYRSNFINHEFNYKNFYTSYNDYKINDILDACYNDTSFSHPTDIYNSQKVVEIINKYGLMDKPRTEWTQNENELVANDYSDFTQKTKNIIIDSEKNKYLDFSVQLFDINPVFSYTKFLLNILGFNTLIVILFEIIRRIFYYIVLGTIRPKK